MGNSGQGPLVGGGAGATPGGAGQNQQWANAAQAGILQARGGQQGPSGSGDGLAAAHLGAAPPVHRPQVSAPLSGTYQRSINNPLRTLNITS